MPKSKPFSVSKEPGIREIYNPTDEEREVLNFVYKDRYEAMKNSEDRSKAMRNWDKWEKQWENWREERRTEDWQSNHVVPLTLSIVETALSELVDQTLRPLILPRSKEDIPRAKVMQYIFDYIWEISDGDLELYNVLKDMLISGTAIAQEYYRQDRRMVYSTGNKDQKLSAEETEVLDYDDCYMEVVKLQDFFPDEKARSMNGPYAARDCIRRYIMNIDDFKLFFKGKIWDQFGNVKYVRPGGDISYYEFYKPPAGIDESKEVEVLWYWSKRPKDRLIILANDVVIKNSPNPYSHKQLPFARAVDIKRVHSFYGKGESELLESTQDEANLLRRMILDRNHLDIDKMFLVSDRLQLDEEDLIARPHGLIPVDDINAAKPIEYGDIPRSVELSLKHLEDDSIISTGINPRAQALPVSGTATEAAILKESTLKRLRMKVWLVKREFLTQIARLRVSNIIQFYSQPKLEKIVGEQESTDFQREIQKLKQEGLLVRSGNQLFKKKYPTVRLEDREINFNAEGGMVENPMRGFSFFETKPEYFVPLSKEGFDVKIEVAPSLQVSKPLMQTKDLELFDRLIQLAMSVPNSYDPVKLGDMVIKSYEKNPNDYKIEQAQGTDMEDRLGMLVDLANQENQQLMGGEEIPPTPYSSPAHTRIHLEFMNGNAFTQIPQGSPAIQFFTSHVVGELKDQMSRGQTGQARGQMMAGGMGVPGQGQTIPTRASQGIENRPGGMKTPAIRTGDILPAFNTGGTRNLP